MEVEALSNSTGRRDGLHWRQRWNGHLTNCFRNFTYDFQWHGHSVLSILQKFSTLTRISMRIIDKK